MIITNFLKLCKAIEIVYIKISILFIILMNSLSQYLNKTKYYPWNINTITTYGECIMRWPLVDPSPTFTGKVNKSQVTPPCSLVSVNSQKPSASQCWTISELYFLWWYLWALGLFNIGSVVDKWGVGPLQPLTPSLTPHYPCIQL